MSGLRFLHNPRFKTPSTQFVPVMPEPATFTYSSDHASAALIYDKASIYKFVRSCLSSDFKCSFTSSIFNLENMQPLPFLAPHDKDGNPLPQPQHPDDVRNRPWKKWQWKPSIYIYHQIEGFLPTVVVRS